LCLLWLVEIVIVSFFTGVAVAGPKKKSPTKKDPLNKATRIKPHTMMTSPFEERNPVTFFRFLCPI
jgi:hypothetical protein